MPHTLLLADDSVTIQRVIELTFADEDVRVIAVSDGDQAIARIEASPPDIVLADIGMPGRNGYEVAQYVKESPRLSHIPVVLLTGAFEPIDQARAAAAGCEGVLAKPFEPQMVISRVKELLGRERPAMAIAPGNEAPARAGDATGGVSASGTPATPGLVAPETTAPAAAVPAPVDAWVPSSMAPFGGGSPKATADLDSYFDQLDQAFNSLGSPVPALPPPTPDVPPAPARDDLDWFGTVNAVSTAPPESWDVAPHAVDGRGDLSLSYGSPAPPIAHEEASIAPDSPPDVVVEPALTAQALPTTEVPHDAAPSTDPWASSSQAEFPVAATDAAAPPAWMTAALEPRSAPAASAPEAPAPAHGEHARSSATAVLPSLADAFAALLDAEQEAGAPAAAPLWPAPAPTAAVGDDVVEQVTQRVLQRLSDRVVRETVSEIVSAIAERMIREEIDRIKASVK